MFKIRSWNSWKSGVKKRTDHDSMVKIGSFLLGIAVGIYMDQSHTMPNVEKWVKMGIRKVKEWEEQTRKS